MEVCFYATLRPIAGCKSAQLPLPDGSSVRRLLEALVERFPAMRDELFDEHDRLLGHVHVFINGRDAPYLEEGLETILGPRDKVDLFPAVAGG